MDGCGSSEKEEEEKEDILVCITATHSSVSLLTSSVAFLRLKKPMPLTLGSSNVDMVLIDSNVWSLSFNCLLR